MDRAGGEWPCLVCHPEGVILRLKVTPGASKTEPSGLWQDRLRLRVQAPPFEGKANEAVRDWVSALLGIRKGEVEIIRGAKASQKDVLLRGLALAIASDSLDRL